MTRPATRPISAPTLAALATGALLALAGCGGPRLPDPPASASAQTPGLVPVDRLLAQAGTAPAQDDTSAALAARGAALRARAAAIRSDAAAAPPPAPTVAPAP